MSTKYQSGQKLKDLTNTKDKIEELKGFEDVIDLLAPDSAPQLKNKKDTKREYPKIANEHEINQYLTHEHNRLQKIDILLSKKIPVLCAHPQAEKLLGIEEKEKNKLKKILVEKLQTPDCRFQKNLADLWNHYFVTASKNLR